MGIWQEQVVDQAEEPRHAKVIRSFQQGRIDPYRELAIGEVSRC